MDYIKNACHGVWGYGPQDMGRIIRGDLAHKIKACTALLGVHRKRLYCTCMALLGVHRKLLYSTK